MDYIRAPGKVVGGHMAPGHLSFDNVVGIGRLSFPRQMSAMVPPFVMYDRHGFRQSQPKAFQMLHASLCTVCRPYQEHS